MKSQLLFIITLLLSLPVYAQNKDETTIRNILQQQTAEWNKGNIEGYMQAGYWQNDSLVFIGKNGPKYGYANTLANYKKSYPNAEAMGHLDFEIISIKKLSADHYFAIGKWFLKRSAGNVGGSWTLLFKKIDGHWKIVVDHSS